MDRDWDRFVVVTRPDGSSRELPLAAWSDELAERVRAAGCTYQLPQEQLEPDGPRAAPLPPNQRRDDSELVQELLDIESGLSSWEIEFSESLARWLERNEQLTTNQRAKALQILKEKG